MVNIIRQINASNDVTFTVHSYSISDTRVETDIDITHDGKSLLDYEPINLNKDDLANLIQVLLEAQNTK